MKRVKVGLGARSYQIVIGAGLLEQASRWLKEISPSGKLVIITNPVVRRLYGDRLKEALDKDGFEATILLVDDGEEHKSLESAARLYSELTERHAERQTPVLALGGGVIGDLAGFVAATYLRGVPLVQIPTTLLAQVDSSIGGKVAVNHGRLKNRVGVFYQPRLVISDTGTLKTLPAGELANGLAEVIKSAVIRDGDFFSYIEKNMSRIKALDDAVLEQVVARSAQIKAEVVAQDETDLGLRNILNYGHTIGHAIETVSDFGMEHGQAVAAGMLAAARISNKMGHLDSAGVTRLGSVIEAAGLSPEIPKLDMTRVMRAIGHDKKVVAGRIRFVLPSAIGSVFITEEVSPSLIEQVLAG